MDATQVKGMGEQLTAFLSEFDDCFGRSEPREHLRTYVGGQLSGLRRRAWNLSRWPRMCRLERCNASWHGWHGINSVW